MLVNVALVGYVYSSFFKENYFASFFKYLAAFLLSYIGLMIISAIGVIVYFIATGKGWSVFYYLNLLDILGVLNFHDYQIDPFI